MAHKDLVDELIELLEAEDNEDLQESAEHEDLADVLLELIEAEKNADLKARAAHILGNFKKEHRYEAMRVSAQEALINFLNSVTITKKD
nr:MAG TPA: hypothetical protein [Caudoviricetes sp.]